MGFFDFLRKDTRATVAAANGDQGPGQLTANGDLRVRDDDLNTLLGGGSTALTFLSGPVSAAPGGIGTIISAPGTGKQIWVYGLWGVAGVAGTLQVRDSNATLLSGVVTLAAQGGFVNQPSGNPSMPWYKCGTNKAFQLDWLVTSGSSSSSAAGGTGVDFFCGSLIYAVVTI